VPATCENRASKSRSFEFRLTFSFLQILSSDFKGSDLEVGVVTTGARFRPLKEVCFLFVFLCFYNSRSSWPHATPVMLLIGRNRKAPYCHIRKRHVEGEQAPTFFCWGWLKDGTSPSFASAIAGKASLRSPKENPALS
jgi:hypothetical protein